MALALHVERCPAAEPPAFPDAVMTTLSEIRMTALACRSAARTDIFEACALLATTRGAARDAYCQALVRCLEQALGRAPVFFRPDVVQMSFDEAWLSRLMETVRRGDEDSLAFLLRSRVGVPHRRLLGYLIGQIAEPDPSP